jgi:molecular chaperone DnaK (HSP70)
VIKELPPRDAGRVLVDVTLELDRSGPLSVEAHVVDHPELKLKASASAPSGTGADVSLLQIQTREVRELDEREAQTLALLSQLKSLCDNMKKFADQYRGSRRYPAWKQQPLTKRLFARIEQCEKMTETPTRETFRYLRESCRRAFDYFATMRPVEFPVSLGMDGDETVDP